MLIDLTHDEINRLISALNSDRWVVTNDLIYRDYTEEMIHKNEAIVLIQSLQPLEPVHLLRHLRSPRDRSSRFSAPEG